MMQQPQFEKAGDSWRAPGGCIPVESLEALILERAPADRRAEMELHLAACSHCAAELSMLREFLHGRPAEAEAADAQWVAQRLALYAPKILAQAQRREKKISWWERLLAGANASRLALAAASLLVVAGAGLYLQQAREPGLPLGVGTEQVLRSGGIRNLSPQGDIVQAPQTFNWSPVDSATSYRVRLVEVDGTELWRSVTPAASVAIPASVQARFVPAKTLRWEVTALDSAGNKLGPPESVSVRVPLR